MRPGFERAAKPKDNSMKLSTLFPRTLLLPEDNQGNSESAAILNAIFIRAYFERSKARRIGWRGILPNNAGRPAWTCRVASSPHTFGIMFDKEISLPQKQGIQGLFKLFIFPESSSKLLDFFPLIALNNAIQKDYPLLVRNFTQEQYFDRALSFLSGNLYMETALDGSGLSLRLEAPSIRRIINQNGIFNSSGQAVVKPGAAESEYRAFKIFLPLLAVLANSLEEIFNTKSTFNAGHSRWDDEVVETDGQVTRQPHAGGILTKMQATVGKPVPGGDSLSHRLNALPLEKERNKNTLNSTLPVLHVLTGFLGSGKTTLLQEWLNFLHDKNRFTGVMQNEFGQVGLDAVLLQGETVVEELDEGCVCCSLADSLRPGLQRLLSALPAQEFILETTGLANPEYVKESLEDLSDLITPGLVLTMVDAIDLAASLVSVPGAASSAAELKLPPFEGVREAQIQAADVLVLNKTDAVHPSSINSIKKSLKKLNPTAKLMLTQWGRIPFAELDQIYEQRAKTKWSCTSEVSPTKHVPVTSAFTLLPMEAALVPHDHAQTHVKEGFNSQVMEFAEAISEAQLLQILHKYMPLMCRIKGLIEVQGQGLMLVQYAAGQLAIEPYLQKTNKYGYLIFIGNQAKEKHTQTKNAAAKQL